MSARAIPKIFVSNLPWTVGHRELKQYFSQYGYVTTASVVFDKDTGLSKGFGFISFSTEGGHSSAVQKSGHSLEGNLLVLQPAP